MGRTLTHDMCMRINANYRDNDIDVHVCTKLSPQVSYVRVDHFSQQVAVLTVVMVTVKREMLVAIIFGGFENITIWQRFNLEILFLDFFHFMIW